MSTNKNETEFSSAEAGTPADLTTAINSHLKRGFEVVTNPSFVEGYDRFVVFFAKSATPNTPSMEDQEALVTDLLSQLQAPPTND